MRTQVSETGLLIPKEWLFNADTVEIIRENEEIRIKFLTPNQDSLLQLGNNPVECGVSDASINHDQYLTASRT